MALRDVYKIAVGLFQAAPGTAYANLLTNMGSSMTVTQLYEAMADSEAFQSQDFDYTNAASNTRFSQQFVADLSGGTYLAAGNTLVGGTLSQANFDFAVNYMVSQLNAGVSRGAVMRAVLDAV